MNNNTEYEREVSVYRKDIDLIDKEIVSLLEKRMEVVGKIGVLKKRYKIEILDNRRESFVIESRASLLKNKCYENAIKSIFLSIMEASRNIQTFL